MKGSLAFAAIMVASCAEAEEAKTPVTASYEACARDIAEDNRPARTSRYSDELFRRMLVDCFKHLGDPPTASMPERSRRTTQLYVDTLAILNSVPRRKQTGPALIVSTPAPPSQRAATATLDPLLREDFNVLTYPLLLCMSSELKEGEAASERPMASQIADAERACESAARISETEALRLIASSPDYGNADNHQLVWLGFKKNLRSMLILSHSRAKGANLGDALEQALEHSER